MKRSMRQKFATVAVAAIVAATGLAACSSSDKETSSASGDTGSKGSAATDISAEITYAFWDENQRAAIQQNVTDFNKVYPNIKVTLNVTPWAQYWTKLQTQAESNTLPDVFWINGPNIALYGSNGMLEPITSLVEAGQLDPANYPDSLNDLYSVDGVQYAVPKDFDTVGVWYNKAIFEEAGVELPKAGWTWEDFISKANEISKTMKDKGIYGVSTSLGGQESYYNTILQAGGTLFGPDTKTSGFDTPEGIAGIQFWTDLIASGASPTPEQLSDTDGQGMFASGKSAMCWTGTWSVSRFLESDHAADFDVVELPRDKVQATVIHGLANTVSADSANKEAAQAFQAYLGSEEAQRTQADMGAANPAFNGTQQAFVDSAPNWNLQMFEDATEYAVPYPVAMNSQAISDLETALLPAAFSGKTPVAEVAKDLATKVNEQLAKG